MTGTERIDAHNRGQREYFEATVKPTMVPRSTPYVRRQVAEMLRFSEIADGDRVVDVGCGMGRYTLPLAERGVAVEGFDLSPVLLERLRGYDAGRHDIALHAGDVREPPAGLVGRFDAALGFFALHHMHDLDACFAGIARLVRPGGRVAFLEPNPWNVLYYAQITLTPRMRWREEKGLLRMRRGPVFSAFAKAGLVRPRIARFGFFPPLLANRAAGAAAERVLERFPLWRPFLPFQMFLAERP